MDCGFCGGKTDANLLSSQEKILLSSTRTGMTGTQWHLNLTPPKKPAVVRPTAIEVSSSPVWKNEHYYVNLLKFVTIKKDIQMSQLGEAEEQPLFI